MQNSSNLMPISDAIPAEQVSIPPNMPQMGGALTRWIGKTLMALFGWKVRGEIPNHKQLVIALAPHTSNWDFFTAMPLIMALGVKVSYLMKKEAFFWPFAKWAKALGGIPIDRSKGASVVEQIAGWFRSHEYCWVAITPEGTRSKVERYKTGFLRIADGADVPVFIITWDYPSRTFTFIEPEKYRGDHDHNAKIIKQQIDAHFVGRNPNRQ